MPIKSAIPFLLTLALLGLPVAVPAQTAQERAREIEERAAAATPGQRDLCELLGDLGSLVMAARQQGETEIHVRSAFAGFEPELIGEIAAQAFEVPRLRAEEDRRFMIAQFGDAYRLSCYRGLAPP